MVGDRAHPGGRTAARPGDLEGDGAPDVPGGDAEPWSALVLAGGQARRLGGRDKAAVVVGGMTLLDRVLFAVTGADRVVVVGPRRELAAPSGAALAGTWASDWVRWAREDPPGGGPVAAIAAGLAEIATPVVVVLAADLPFLTGRELTRLRHAVAEEGTDAALLVDPEGRRQFLAAIWRTSVLRAAMPADPVGRPVRGLFADRAVTAVPVSARACLDCDEPADVARARRWAVLGARRDGRPGTEAARFEVDAARPDDDAVRSDAETVAHGGGRTATIVAVTPADRASAPQPSIPLDPGPAPVSAGDAAGSGTVDRWVAWACAELGLDPADLDVRDLLDLTREVAHGVARPAAPLTAFLVGLAAGRAGGDRAAVRAATDAVRRLIAPTPDGG